MKTPRETELVRACLDLLKHRGVHAWRNNSGAATLFGRGGDKQLVRFGLPGSSDILGILPPVGRFLAVECKRPGGKLTATQRAFLDGVQEAGGVGLLIDDVKELDRELDLLGV